MRISQQTIVHCVDTRGEARQIGVLYPKGDGYLWAPSAPSAQPFKFPGLPWFLQDMRPEGFIGRAIARHIGHEMHLPEQLQDWSDEHLLSFLSHYGHDCVGNLIVGQEALEHYRHQTLEAHPPIRAEEVPGVYPRLSQAAMDGDLVVSSVGGEQPKFTAVIDRNESLCNVLVKFSPIMDTPAGRRWADLLVCEHLALEAVKSAGVDSCRSRLIVAADRVFLEVERFDRVGRFGRVPINSLGVVDDQFFGNRDNWIAMADRLESADMVEPKDAESLRWQWAFGAMIANTDMHFGNASLILRDASKPTFTLAPAYDMLPMLYRPWNGEVVPREFTLPLVASASKWESARRHALLFWDAASSDESVSMEFREICVRNRKLLA